MSSIIHSRPQISEPLLKKIRSLCTEENNEHVVFELTRAFGEQAFALFLEETPDKKFVLRRDWVFPNLNLLRLIACHGASTSGFWHEFYHEGFFADVMNSAIDTHPLELLHKHEKDWFLQRSLTSTTLPKGVYHVSNGPAHISYSKETLSREVTLEHDIDVCHTYVSAGLIAHAIQQKKPLPATRLRQYPWNFAIQWCNLFSKTMGKEPVYEIGDEHVDLNHHANGYRLLTETEWEATFLHERIPQLHLTNPRAHPEWVFDSFCGYHYLLDGTNPIFNDSQVAFRVQRDVQNLFDRRAGWEPGYFRLCTRSSGGIV